MNKTGGLCYFIFRSFRREQRGSNVKCTYLRPKVEEKDAEWLLGWLRFCNWNEYSVESENDDEFNRMWLLSTTESNLFDILCTYLCFCPPESCNPRSPTYTHYNRKDVHKVFSSEFQNNNVRLKISHDLPAISINRHINFAFLTWVWYPSGNEQMKSWALARFAAWMASSAGVVSGIPYRMLDKIVPENKVGSCVTMPVRWRCFCRLNDVRSFPSIMMVPEETS